jgi:hypothetical protein
MFDRKVDQFKNGVFTWFIGEVKDINDSKNLNRVRVNAYGYYDGVENVADLPWATVMMPTTSASIKGNGSNHHLEVGSWVVGFFADGPSAQDPIIMGSIATQTNGVKDIPSDASVDNKVYESKAGHRIELDNTSGAEKIKITHGKTNSHIEFTSTGKIRII